MYHHFRLSAPKAFQLYRLFLFAEDKWVPTAVQVRDKAEGILREVVEDACIRAVVGSPRGGSAEDVAGQMDWLMNERLITSV